MPTGPNNRKILELSAPGTATTIGGNDYDYLVYWFENTDLTAGAFAAVPKKATVNTPTEFRDNKLRFLNPAQTKSLRIRTLAFTEDYDLTIPLVAGNDDFLLLSHPAQIYNKTISADDNSLIATGISLGDILKSNGTKFVRLGRGLPNQVLTVKDDGLDLEWADIPPAVGGGTPDDNSVTTAKIVDSAVTDAKLAGSISGGKILDGVITAAKMADLTITGSKIANTTITGSKIANTSITNTQIASATILGTNMVNGTVGTTQLADNAITTAKIADGQVTSIKLVAGLAGAPFLTSDSWGMAAGQNVTTGGPTGILDPLTLIRTHTAATGSTFTGINVGTGTSANTLAGQRTTNKVARRSWNSEVFVRFDITPVTNTRLFIGWASTSSLTASNDDFLDTIHGVGLLLKNNGTTYRMVRNDGSATDNEVTTGFPAPVTTPVSFYMKFDNSVPSLLYKVWTTNNGDASGTPIATGTITSQLPGPTVEMWFHMVISNSTTTESFLGRHVVYAKNTVI